MARGAATRSWSGFQSSVVRTILSLVLAAGRAVPGQAAAVLARRASAREHEEGLAVWETLVTVPEGGLSAVALAVALVPSSVLSAFGPRSRWSKGPPWG